MENVEQNAEQMNEDEKNSGRKRGFAAMSPERQKEIASKGGKAAHKQGVAHKFDADEARKAGQKGGQAVSRNREHMAEIGRRGGKASGSKRKNDETENNDTDTNNG